MDRKKVHDIEVDQCPSCASVWLDKGELGALVHAPADEVGTIVAREEKRAVPPLHADVRLDCPACHGQLTTLVLPEQNIMRCSHCQGVLVDKDDLEKVLSAIGTEWKNA